MVDIFALALSHGLLIVAAWRLAQRPGLDREGAPDAMRRGTRRMRVPGQPDPDA